MSGGDGERIELEGGNFTIGRAGPLSYPGDGEEPREFELDPLLTDAHAVSNAHFAQFAEATGHQTDAERYEWSFVFAGLLPDDCPDTRGVARAPWWRQVYGADWRHPEGPSPSSPSGPAIRWSTFPGPTPSPTASGRRRGCRARPSGSLRPAVDWLARCFPEGTTWSRVASTR